MPSKSSISLFMLCLYIPSIMEYGWIVPQLLLLNYLLLQLCYFFHLLRCMYVDNCYIFLFLSINNCYIFCFYQYIIYIIPLFSVKKSSLSISIYISTLFWLLFIWNIFPILLFSTYFCLFLSKVSFLQIAYNCILLFYPFSSVCMF